MYGEEQILIQELIVVVILSMYTAILELPFQEHLRYSEQLDER